MFLIQLLLPLYDNDGHAFPAREFKAVADLLTTRFGGLTAYTRAPAEGLWREEANSVARDEIIIYEVMSPALDGAWWREYRSALERKFRQERLVLRAHAVTML